MLDIDAARTAIREEGLDGWLFTTMHHRDEIADTALGIPREATNTRPWAYLLLRGGDPVRIVHEIEPSILDHLPGVTVRYHARDAFRAALSGALPAGSRVAAQFSPDIPVGSFLDHGTALMLQALGIQVLSSANLVARCLGALDPEGIRSHDAAALVLYDSVAAAWERISDALGSGRTVREAEVQGWLSDSLSAAGLVSDAPPLVAAGVNSANPHYDMRGPGAAISPGDVVQFDVWARADTPAAVYADISWVGVAAVEPTDEQRAAFHAVAQAREAALELMSRGPCGGAGDPRTGCRRGCPRVHRGHGVWQRAPPSHGAFHRPPGARLRREPGLHRVPRQQAAGRGSLFLRGAGDLSRELRHAQRGRLPYPGRARW